MDVSSAARGKFHDGSELTAEAVRCSFERLLALGKAPSAVFKRMGLTADKVRVITPYTVEFQLEQPVRAVSDAHSPGFRG